MLVIVFLAPTVLKVEAVTTIYIRADGSVEPSDAPIQHPDNLLYVLTDNITTTGGGNGIVILKDNIVLDGAGYTIHQSHEMNGLDVSGRRNVTIRNICVEMFDVGIYLFDSNNCSITGCIVGNNTENVWLEQSSNNTLSENTVKYAGVHGIVLRTSSENNTIAQNQLQAKPTGIMLWRSSRYNSVFANHVNGSDTAGIYMTNSSRSDIFDNNVSNSYNGLRLDTYSYENKIHGNTIEHSTYWGIYIGSSSNNTFYQNNLLDNPSQVVGDSSVNLWDNGSQGNYWSDYNGTDANHDGIGNTAYAINANNSDRYPLIEPYVVEKKHQVRLLSVNASRRMVRSGNPMVVDVQVMNTGDYTETFKVTIYAGKTVIGTRTVTLGAHSVQTVPFLWQTAGFKIKNYVISSVVTPVSSEMQIINNGLSDLNAVQVMGDGCCIVVAGTKLNDEIRNVIAHGAVTVYQTLREAGYSDDDIYFMMQPEFNPDVDGDGQNDVDNNSTSQNLQWAIEEWAEHRVSPNAPLILFIFTHGSLNYLSIREYEGVSSYQLATWIGNLENATNAQVHFFLSACHSGSFIDDLSKTGRVIVTSCNGTESSWVSHGQWEIFGETFWNQIKSGHSVGFSFLVACDLMPPDSYVGGPYQQTPLLDDNGDGVGHTFSEYDGDGYVASSLHIGRCEWPYPWISYVTAKQTLPCPPSSSVNLAAQVENETNLAHVRAYMQPPDWMPSPPNDTLGVLNFEWFEMMDPDHDGNWTVDIPMVNFTNHAFGSSNFTFFITAEEEDNNTATPRTVNVEFTETGSPSADVLKPIVNVERPLEETVVHNVICVNGSVSDDACVEKVELYVDDNLYDSLDLQPYSTSYFEFNLNTAMLANGARNILVKAFDASDNSANQSMTVYVNNFVHDIIVTDVTSSQTPVNQGENVGINVTVANHGSFAEIFNLALYANMSAVGSQILTLQPGEFNMVSFDWNTTGFGTGNYTLNACAEPVEDETDTTNNCLALTEQPITIIPEFPLMLILPVFILATLVTIIICKRRRPKLHKR
jgi:parallel beta-helix repeat protein